MDRNREKNRHPSREGDTSSPAPGRQPRAWVIIAALLGAWVLTALVFGALDPTPRQELTYTEFKHELSAGRVSNVTVKGARITGTLSTENEDPGRQETRFETRIPSFGDPDLITLLEQHEVTIAAEEEARNWWGPLLLAMLPWLLIVGLFVYANRQFQQRMGGVGGQIFGFGRSRAKRYQRSESEVRFHDVAGLKNAKEDLQEIITYLADPKRFRSLGAELPKGVLLLGPPGSGKTLLARAAAGEAGVPFFSLSGSEFIEMFVGVGASRVRDLFESAKKEAPAIIFIDELDAIGRSRGAGLGGGHDEREQTLNQILSEMDGFSGQKAVVVIAATNRPDVLDPALTRPGRFDRHITVDRPDRQAREQILGIHTRRVPLSDDVDLADLAARTVGLSGADLKNLVNEAALLAGRNHRRKVGAQDFDQARSRILLGHEREDFITDEEKALIAYHEAGHALLARLLPHADPLTKVSIIPRGRALGATEQMPEEERHNLAQGYLLDRLAVMMGGRVAEKLVFNEYTTGAGSDLKQATQLARQMVCQWGMSERLGAVTFRFGEEHVFLGRELTQDRDFSEHSARIIDEEIRRLLHETEARAEQLLAQSRDQLERLAQALLERETLEADEIDALLSGSPQPQSA